MNDCPNCNGSGYVEYAAYTYGPEPEPTYTVEVCDVCHFFPLSDEYLEGVIP